jgi:hypothetical protein
MSGSTVGAVGVSEGVERGAGAAGGGVSRLGATGGTVAPGAGMGAGGAGGGSTSTVGRPESTILTRSSIRASRGLEG